MEKRLYKRKDQNNHSLQEVGTTPIMDELVVSTEWPDQRSFLGAYPPLAISTPDAASSHLRQAISSEAPTHSRHTEALGDLP
jgi:hypothetical protein